MHLSTLCTNDPLISSLATSWVRAKFTLGSKKEQWIRHLDIDLLYQSLVFPLQYHDLRLWLDYSLTISFVMASQPASSGPSLLRYRPAIVAVLAIAAGITGYYLHTSLSVASAPSNSGRLHRSNAVRRNRQLKPIDTHVAKQDDHYPISPTTMKSSFHYGDFVVTSSRRETIELPLVHWDLPSASNIAARHAIRYTEAVQIRQNLEVAFLDAFFGRAMPTGPLVQLSGVVRQSIVESLGFSNDISPVNTLDALDRYCNGELEDHPNRVERREHEREQDLYRQQHQLSHHSEAAERSSNTAIDRSDPDLDEQGAVSSHGLPETEDSEAIPVEFLTAADNAANLNAPSQDVRSPAETVVERSDFAWRGETEDNSEHKKQTVLGLVYHIAEEQARKEGYVHRGVTCNGCSAIPIRGIRYHCTNCADFDLCELCEAQQIHDRTHLFYKVRIPAPFLGNSRQPQAVCYPGKPRSSEYVLSKEDRALLCQRTGLQMPVLEALWEQFKCLAAVEYPEDPTRYYLAIDRPTFDKCFIPKSTGRSPPPNLIYDRMFCFYDTNDDGLIGFQEFVFGISSIGYKKPAERVRQIFNGYDIDNDGFVSRIDFQKMFKALFNLHKELAKDIVTRIDDEVYDEEVAREVINSSQALSSAFSGSIPSGDPSRTNEGKRKNIFGDYVVKKESIETVEPEDNYPDSWPDEQDYGQEVLYHVIEDSINELLDPLFSLREDIGLAVHRAQAERKKYPDQLALLRRAGFWIMLEVLINRFEQDWWARTGKDLIGIENRSLITYIQGTHIYITFEPSEKYCQKRKRHVAAQWDAVKAAGLVDEAPHPPETLTEARRLARLLERLTNRLKIHSQDQDQNQAEVIETPPGDLSDVKDAIRALCTPPTTPASEREDFIEQTPQTEGKLPLPETAQSDPTSETSSSASVSEDAQYPTSLPDEPSSGTSFDADWPTNPTLPQNLPLRTDAEELSPASMAHLSPTKTLSESGLYEFSEADRPTDPTLPQNLPDRIIPPDESPEAQPQTNANDSPILSGLNEPSQNSIAAGLSQDTEPDRIETNSAPVKRPLSPPTPRPSSDLLKYLSLTELLAMRDADRGGPGRISLEEFEEIMNGPKAEDLGFLGAWIEKATF